MISLHRNWNIHLLRGEITELFIANTIREFGASMMGLFIPIYMYVALGHDLVRVLFLFALMQAAIMVFSPFAGKLNGRLGVKHTMLLSVPFLNIFLFSLIKIADSEWFIIPLVLGYAIALPLYWIGLHTDFARYSKDEKRGVSIGGFRAFMLLAGILGPLFGGLIVALFGFQILFMLVILLETIALFPLLLTPDIHEPYEVHIIREWRSIFLKKRWRDVLAFAAEGFDMKTAGHLWPIFLFLTLGGVVAAGGLTTAALIIAMLIGLLSGKLSDRNGKRPIFIAGVSGTVLAWFLRVLMRAPFGIFIADTVAKLSANIYQVPYLGLVYERARGYGDRLEHYIIIREVAHSFGALVMFIVAMAFFTYTSFSIASFFLIAGAASLFLLFYAYEKRA